MVELIVYASVLIVTFGLIGLSLAWMFKNEIRAIGLARRFPREEFVCARCGKCCGFVVNLSKADLARLKGAGVDEKDVVERKLGVAILKHVDDKCVFLKWDADGKAACDVYAHRPYICRRFPYCRYLGMRAADPRCPVFKRG